MSAGRVLPGRPLRVVVFGGSLVSDLENPSATSHRAVLDALADLGHEVTFLEQRGHPSLLTLLKRHGSHAVRAFTERYQGISYRTFNLSRGWERTVSFGREVATADVVVALPGTPVTLLPEILALPSPHPVTLVDVELDRDGGTFRLRRADDPLREDELPWGPAVSCGAELARDPRGLLVVAYDSAAQAIEAVHACGDLPFDHVVSGSAELPGWRFVPEVELPRLYARYAGVIVAGAGDDVWAGARRLLPLASGCRLIDPGLETPVSDQMDDSVRTHVPARYDARVQAEAIVAAIRAHQLGNPA